MKFVVLFVVLFVAVVVRCQEVLEEDVDNAAATSVDERSEKEKRGIALNLGGAGVEGYSYFGPSSRGLNRGYTPMTEYGYDGVNYGMGSQNFGGGYQGYGGGYNSMPYGASPYGNRGGYPTSYSNFRLYNTPVNTYPLGGIGTVGAYGAGGGAYGGYGLNGAGPYGGGAYGGFAPNAGFNGGFNRLGIDQQYQGGYQPGGIY